MNKEFSLRAILPTSAFQVIQEIGFDKGYVHKAIEKYDFKLIKVENLSCPQATIIKQVALSAGADAALHREVLTAKVDRTDLLIGATLSQIKQICHKLEHQPFKLKKLASEILNLLNAEPTPLRLRGTTFEWSKKSYIMGILNTTPDSFSDGGKYSDTYKALSRAEEMISDGADIIDIGGESTRPFSQEVTDEEEIKRTAPVIKAIRARFPQVVLSIDTRHAQVARAAIEAGADIINDVSGLDYDSHMAQTAADLQVPVIIMHSQGTPETMQVNPEYTENVVDSVYNYLRNKIADAEKAGIKKQNIIIDPGIGFGKSQKHNEELIRRTSEFKSLGCPLLIGISRKSVIANVLNLPPEEREEANIALNTYVCTQGADIIRVHDVKKHFRALKMLDCIIR